MIKLFCRPCSEIFRIDLNDERLTTEQFDTLYRFKNYKSVQKNGLVNNGMEISFLPTIGLLDHPLKLHHNGQDHKHICRKVKPILSEIIFENNERQETETIKVENYDQDDDLDLDTVDKDTVDVDCKQEILEINCENEMQPETPAEENEKTLLERRFAWLSEANGKYFCRPCTEIIKFDVDDKRLSTEQSDNLRFIKKLIKGGRPSELTTTGVEMPQSARPELCNVQPDFEENGTGATLFVPQLRHQKRNLQSAFQERLKRHEVSKIHKVVCTAAVPMISEIISEHSLQTIKVEDCDHSEDLNLETGECSREINWENEIEPSEKRPKMENEDGVIDLSVKHEKDVTPNLMGQKLKNKDDVIQWKKFVNP